MRKDRSDRDHMKRLLNWSNRSIANTCAFAVNMIAITELFEIKKFKYLAWIILKYLYTYFKCNTNVYIFSETGSWRAYARMTCRSFPAIIFNCIREILRCHDAIIMSDRRKKKGGGSSYGFCFISKNLKINFVKQFFMIFLHFLPRYIFS